MEIEGEGIKGRKMALVHVGSDIGKDKSNLQENVRTVVPEGLESEIIPETSDPQKTDRSNIDGGTSIKEDAHNRLKVVETTERTSTGFMGRRSEKPKSEDLLNVEQSVLATGRTEIRTEMDVRIRTDVAEEAMNQSSVSKGAGRTSLFENRNLDKDYGGKEPGILSIAGKLRDLGAELNVDMVDKFEAFLRSQAIRSLDENSENILERNRTSDSTNNLEQNEDLAQNIFKGDIASDSCKLLEQNIPEQNVASGSGKVLEQVVESHKSNSVVSKVPEMDVDVGHTVSEENNDSKNGNSSSSEIDEDLQMAINLAIARKKRLLAEDSSSSVKGEDAKMETSCTRADVGSSPVGEAGTRLTSGMEEVKGSGMKRERSPEEGEIDEVFKQVKLGATLQVENGTKGVTWGEDSENRSTNVWKEGEVPGVAMEIVEGEDQDLVDAADRVVETCKYSFSETPVLLMSAQDDFLVRKDNFLKGCKWSPDGTCILTNSDDGVLRLFNLPSELYNPQAWAPLPEVKAILEMVEGGLVFDYAWFPRMTSLSPETCCFASTSRGHPVHMWDAFTGQLRCSYRPHDHMDELISTYSLGFSLDGTKLYCGCNKLIKVFDTTRPGKACEAKQTKGKLGGQSGIISCFAMSPDGSTYAAGSYSKSIGIYNDTCPSAIAVLQGRSSGLTHLMFSIDGTKIYSASRMDDNILCWDVRRSKDVLFSMRRNVTTNQRVYFDIDREDRFLVSGNQDGDVIVWDLTIPCSPSEGFSHPVLERFTKFTAHGDTTNGISIHPWLPLLATASGQRVIPPPSTFGSDGESDEETAVQEPGKSVKNSLRIWSLQEKAPL